MVTLLCFVVIFTGCKEVSPKKPDLCSFSIRSDYSEPVSIFILKYDSQNFGYFDIVEHHIIKPNTTTNITTIANPKDTSWGFGWYNGRISAGSLSFWIDAKPSINSKGQLTCIFDGEIDVFPDTLRLYEENQEEIQISVTADEVPEKIANMYGKNKITVTGECNTNQIIEIGKALIENNSAEIILDLSGTTGLTEIPSRTFAESYSLVEIILPDSVTEIGEEVFVWCRYLKKVENLKNIKTISNFLFYACSSLQSITIPASVTSIEKSAFARCESLKDITIEEPNACFIVENGAIYTADKTTLIAYPTASGDVIIDNSVSRISYGAFSGSSIVSITIPNSVTEIGEDAFSNCAFLKKIYGLGNISTIPFSCFMWCENLESITIPSSVTSIEDWAFCGCANLTDINIEGNNFIVENGAIYTANKTTLIAYPTANGNIIIPATVNKIGSGSFTSCQNLKTLDILGNVSIIPNETFYNCEKLESITIPASVTEIGWGAFRYCTSLTSITYSGTEEMWNEILIEEENEVLNNVNITYKNEVEEIPLEAVTVTASNAYSTIASLSGRVKVIVEGSCSSSDITEIGEALRNNPDARIILDLSGTIGLTEIQEWAFEQCDSLLEISLPDSVTEIGHGAFRSCINLQKVCNLGSITSINHSSFNFCRRLKSITIPSSVTNIDGGAFGYCINLTDINIEGNNFIAEDGAIYTSDKTTLIAYPTASGDVIIDNSVTTIGDSAFCFSDITSVAIPNSVTEIGEDAFSSSSLKTVKSLGTITSIPAWCFTHCENLESITIPASVTSIDGGAFGYCPNLTDINIEGNNFIYEDGVIYTSDKTTLVAFPNATGSITIEDTVTNINDHAFYSTNISSITIPSTVSSIGVGIFRFCSNLKSVEILGNITMIPNETFYGCEKLESITIPASVTEFIGWGAFCDCTSLTSITYSGTEEMWNEITINSENNVLNNVNITFLGEVSN